MPDCGHMVRLKTLDQDNCQHFYHIDLDGVIQCINTHPHGRGSVARVPELREPKCTCGKLCPSVHRYSAIQKMAAFPRTLDLLLAKMGQRMYRFTKSIEFFQQSLSDSLETFISEIRPNPLAALANTRHLLQRQRDVVELHKNIVRYRNEVVVPVEESLQSLHVVMSRRVPHYAMLFQTRFDILEYRAMSLRIADDLKLASLMVKSPDPSQGVQRQGLKMLQFVCKQSLVCMEYCQEALSRRHVVSAPPLETELRLQQAQFYIFGAEASLRLSRLSCASPSFAPRLSEESVISGLQLVLKEDGPNFAGRKAFMKTFREFQNYFSSMDKNEVGEIPVISNESSRIIEKSWGHHELGALTTCPRVHVYSRKTFARGCPDCGSLLPAAPEIKEPARPLREGDFLKVMHELCLNTKQPALSGVKQVSGSNSTEPTIEKESLVLESRLYIETSDSEHGQEAKQEIKRETQKDADGNTTDDIEQEKKILLKERETKDLENREKFLAAMRKLGL